MNTIFIAFTNFKGGTSKTTSCRELGFYLAHKGYTILIVDCDSQGNLTKSVLDEHVTYEGMCEALTGKEYKEKEIVHNLYVLPGDFRVSEIDKYLTGRIDCYTCFKEIFRDEEFAMYDFIFFDTAPSLNNLTTNALVCADFLMIPLVPNHYSLQGTNDLMSSVSQIKKSLNPSLDILGVIIYVYDRIPVIAREIREEIIEAFGEKTFKTIISKSIKFEEAVSQKTGVIHLKRLDKSRAKDEVISLGEEFLSRITIRDKKLPVMGG